MKIPTDREPTRPSEFIREDILEEFDLSQAELALKLGVTRQTVVKLVTDRSSITTEMAFKLGKLTGTDPQYWLNIQMAHDIWKAKQHEEEITHSVQALQA